MKLGRYYHCSFGSVFNLLEGIPVQRYSPPTLLGNNPAHISPFPTGNCTLCCPIEPDQDIQYQLYTRRNPTIPNILAINDATTLQRSSFNRSNPTIFYIHGYSERAPGLSAATIRDAYLRRGEYNVVLVDWGKLSALPWYITAVRNTRIVGPHVAGMVRWLEAQGAVPASRVHVIGFSLGAEVAGFMGKSLIPQQVGRITGLDAAFPLYMNTGTDGHLTATDASFVDVIHTDGGIFGFPSPLGHADFYPNGGRPTQPGCTADNIIFDGITRVLNQYIACGHNRAWQFYAESVGDPNGFPASRCSRWRIEIPGNCTWTPDARMGFAADSRIRGMFYLRTNAQPPFARNTTGYGIRR
ncbi:inactive pancreatic lipase-related protein 1 isoform X2 [Neodiprion lecontei]|uniref:phospholipase A1 n=1 Tax=Neodiprion lecontei TaxID=441921 RepID=A0ABM3GR10_NEOLC|nr:inactive pancreatic lipase-related protein 1 isoform X2 [Neodiprion lecontei]